MPGRSFRKRLPHVATAAVLAALAIGASAVWLAGSAQRRDDRAMYLRYERALLPPIREGGRITELRMKPSLSELGEGRLSTAMALDRASEWRNTFTTVRAQVLALAPPGFLGDIERRWAAAMDGYLEIPDLFEQAARATGGTRTALLTRAAAAGDRADDLFDRAAAVMQAHRRRLGLGPTRSLPDPAGGST